MSGGEIVVVDDNPANLKILCSILNEDGYEARPAISAAVALTAIAVSIPDLILLDVQMPTMNGIEVCAILQADPRFADIPIVFISALTEPEDKVRAFRAGGVDYITKPFQVEEVLARVRLHVRLHKLTARVQSANVELQRTLEDLTTAQAQLVESEKMAALGGLVAGVAHEVNTPLGVAVTAISTVLTETETFQASHPSLQDDADLAELLDVVVDGAMLAMSNLRRADELTESFKRVAVDRSRAESQQFLLVPYIEEVVAMLRPALRESRHRITVTGSRDIALVSDPGSFSQVLTNLTMNSIHHGYEPGHPGGDLNITAIERGGEITVTFADDGVGIVEADLKRIFEPFYTSARVRGRSGLGLHVVYNVVTQIMNGTIEAGNTPSGGAVFTVRIPT